MNELAPRLPAHLRRRAMGRFVDVSPFAPTECHHTASHSSIGHQLSSPLVRDELAMRMTLTPDVAPAPHAGTTSISRAISGMALMQLCLPL